MKHFWTLCAAVLLTIPSAGQIKLQKQTTSFWYLQGNLHAGLINDLNGTRWDCADLGPRSQVSLQHFTKRQKNLQQGYIPLITLTSTRIRVAASYDRRLSFFGDRRADARLQLVDAYLHFNTKWDRTTLRVGYAPLLYGHHPTIDPLSTFMANLMSTDLGMTRDAGVFLKMPLSKSLDFDIAVTSGGWLNQPLVLCDELSTPEQQVNGGPEWNFADFDYAGTYLVSGRIGSPSFKKMELAFVYAAGRVPARVGNLGMSNILRGGGEFIYKYKSRLKWNSQITYGTSRHLVGRDYQSFNMKHQMEWFLWRRIALNTGYSLNYHTSFDDRDERVEEILTNSITYTLTPHTRIRLNQYVAFETISGERYGFFLQLVTGIGKRP